MEPTVIRTDVLIIGGGGAGFRAAIAVKEKGVESLLVSKGPLARCGASPMAGADFTLDGRSLSQLGIQGEPKDTPEYFMNDIVTQGYYLNNQKLVEQYIIKAPLRLREMLSWGLKVNASEERAIFTAGLGLMDVIARKAKAAGVPFLEDVMVTDLLVKDGKAVGALGIHIPSGNFIHFIAKAVVMATGGWHKAFWPNTGMRDLSGEGIAAAHRAGAEIGNMEFITFCCNVLLSPPTCRGSIATYIMGNRLRLELINSLGEPFLTKYDPVVVEYGTTMEWNKGFVSFASQQEIRAGKGSPNNGVYLHRGRIPWEEVEKITTPRFPNWKYKALDISEVGRKLKENEPIEVGPAVEYFEGGIVVNEKFETSLEGLYAAGECTLGPFGANRVCSAITEMLVHGADAGENAAIYAKANNSPDVSIRDFEPLEVETEQSLKRAEGIKPAPIRRQVQEMAHKHLSPIRNQKELQDFLSYLNQIEKEQIPNLAAGSKGRVYNKGWVDAIELKNMVHLLKVSTMSALRRTESRGVHYREDYPQTDNDHWLQEIIVKYNAGSFLFSQRPAMITTLTPPEGKIPFLEMMKKMMQSRSNIGGHH